MDSKTAKNIQQIVSMLNVPTEDLTASDVDYCTRLLSQALDSILHAGNLSREVVSCVENCLAYLEEMQGLDNDDPDFVIIQSVVMYELGKIC